MTRIPGLTAEEAEPLAQTFDYARYVLAELTGREPDRILEAVEVTAHAPLVLQAHGQLQGTTAEMNLVDRRLKGLAELKAATLTHCGFCIDIGSQILRRWGLTDEELLALPSYQTSPLFTDVEKTRRRIAPCSTRCCPTRSRSLTRSTS